MTVEHTRDEAMAMGFPTLVVGPGQVSHLPVPGRIGEAYLFNWIVDPEARGQGHGGAVLDALLLLADQQEVALLTHPDTPRLEEVFARRGFVADGFEENRWEGKPLMLREPRT